MLTEASCFVYAPLPRREVNGISPIRPSKGRNTLQNRRFSQNSVSPRIPFAFMVGCLNEPRVSGRGEP